MKHENDVNVGSQYFEKSIAAWREINSEFQSSGVMKRLSQGDLNVKHYCAILREIYFQARENPQIQALAAVRFRGEQRALVKDFFRHAISEIGHDQLALNDLTTLGVDVSDISRQRPLASTLGVTSFAFHQIEHLGMMGYLGYLFHLEFLPTQTGNVMIELLSRAGVPKEAQTFLIEHATVDIGHNKLMERYFERLVKSEDDFQEVLYAIRVTATLYNQMLTEAVLSVDRGYTYQLKECPAEIIA